MGKSACPYFPRFFLVRSDQATGLDDLGDERRERLGGERRTGVEIGDGAGLGIDSHLRAVGDGVHGLGALEDREAHVDGIAIEDARKALGDDAGHARRLDGHRCVLARRTAAEVLLGHDDVTGLHARGERGVEVLHGVRREVRMVGAVEVAGRNDDVGVDIAPIAENGAFEVHG